MSMAAMMVTELACDFETWDDEVGLMMLVARDFVMWDGENDLMMMIEIDEDERRRMTSVDMMA